MVVVETHRASLVSKLLELSHGHCLLDSRHVRVIEGSVPEATPVQDFHQKHDENPDAPAQVDVVLWFDISPPQAIVDFEIGVQDYHPSEHLRSKALT